MDQKYSKSRRILTMTPFIDNTCGVGTVASSLNKKLVERGNEVDVLEYRPWRDSKDKREKPYLFISGNKEISFSNSKEVVDYFKDNSINYDVIHSHNQVFADMKNESLFNYFKDTPVLTQVHCITPYDRDVLKDKSPNSKEEVHRQARMFSKSDRIVHLTEDLENMAKSYYGEEHPEKTSVIYNFAEKKQHDQKRVNYLRNKFSRNGEKIFLYAGRVSPEKGTKEMIEGFKKAKKENSNIKLVICGSTPTDENNEFYHSLEGLVEGKDYFLEGKVSQEDLSNYYQAADFFIQPSKYEHFSISLIEAMAHGKPIIMSKVPSMRKLMKLDSTREERYAIPIGDLDSPDSIKDSFLEATNLDKNSLEDMVLRAKDFYETNLTPNKITERYEKEYDSLISEKKKLKKFDHAYLIPTAGEDVKNTISSIFLKDPDSSVVVSAYSGYKPFEELSNYFSKEIDLGKLKILNSDERITNFKSNALNKGISESTKSGTNTFSIVLPGDTIESSLRLNNLESDPKVKISFNKTNFDFKDKKLTDILKEKNPISQSQTTFDKSIFDTFGGFYDYMNYAEDYDFYNKTIDFFGKDSIKKKLNSLEDNK